MSKGQIIAAVHIGYLILFGAATLVWLRGSGVAVRPLMAVICFLPAMLTTWLAFTSMEDFYQYLLRIAASALFGPVLLLFWSCSVDPDSPIPARVVWPFAVCACLAHGAAFAGSVLWTGSFATRVPAVESAAPSTAGELMGRLTSLSGVPFEVRKRGEGELAATYRFGSGSGRGHVVLLNLNGAERRVRVRERLSADGADPANANEASMRGSGDAAFDPARPNAQAVYGWTAQTSFVPQKWLAEIQVILDGGTVRLPGDHAATDPAGMVTLLCAVVTRSGWSWEPAFFGED